MITSILFTVMLLTIVPAVKIHANAAESDIIENINNSEKIFSNVKLEDDFANNEIIVVLDIKTSQSRVKFNLERLKIRNVKIE